MMDIQLYMSLNYNFTGTRHIDETARAEKEHTDLLCDYTVTSTSGNFESFYVCFLSNTNIIVIVTYF